ncbi:MAG: C1 family peptidase [Candidatus Sericytochromatia bacterium]|nr:C1 family peptidase [Candidatus Sericytochromatia bacterium]
MRKSLLILLAVVTGCGTPAIGYQSASSGAEALAKRSRSARHGMGCKLDGLKKLVIDEAGFSVKANLPERVDLRPGCSPISNQGQSSACVAFATVDGLGEYLAAKQGRRADLSPRYIWNLTRHQEKTLDQNEGTYPVDAMKIVDNLGMALETDFPTFSPAVTEDPVKFMPLVTERPTPAHIAKAKKNRLFTGWKAIDTVHAMRQSIANGMPVVFAIDCYPSMSEGNTSGVIPMPKANEESEGGHAILCVGYDNAKRQFIFRNSWGTEWGDKGYGYLPFDYMKSGHAYQGFTAKP